MGTSYRIIVRASTDIEKCINLFETIPKVLDREDAVPVYISEEDLISKKKGEISFNNVSFTYKVDNLASGGIRNVTFTVRPGRMLGIVGASGMSHLVPRSNGSCNQDGNLPFLCPYLVVWDVVLRMSSQARAKGK